MKSPERRVAVFAKPHPLAAAVLAQVAGSLSRHGLELLPDGNAARTLGLGEGLERELAARDAELVVSVGGDGTLLASARAVGDSEVPILGVNLGNLGFLTETTSGEVAAVLDAVLEGRASVIRRRMLRLMAEDRPDWQGRTALNDVTFSKKDLARLFLLSLFVDGEWVADYRADGLILGTPTGSTAYNLAAGGPIVAPNVDCLLATPICPHSLSQRPLILPGEARITVQLSTDAGAHDVVVTLDGQVGFPLDPGARVAVDRAPHDVLLVRPAGRTFFSVLRDKLGWGHP